MSYNPGVQFDPGIISRGWENAAGSLAGAITHLGAESERKKKEDKAALALFDALEPDEGDDGSVQPHPAGITRDQLQSKSREDRIAFMGGFVKAHVLKSAMAEQKQRAEESAMRRQEHQMRLGAAVREGQDADAMSGAVRDSMQIQVPASEDTGPASIQTVPLNAQRLREAIAQRGGGGPAGMKFLLDSEEAAGPISFDEDPVSGTRFARHRNTVLPSGVNPERAGKAVAITGPGGEELGMGLPGRSSVTPLQTGSVKDKDRHARLAKQLNGLIAAQGKAAYNQTAFDAYQKQIDELLPQIQELESGSAPVSGAATSAATVTTKAQFDALASGTVYTGKDGKQYRKP